MAAIDGPRAQSSANKTRARMKNSAVAAILLSMTWTGYARAQTAAPIAPLVHSLIVRNLVVQQHLNEQSLASAGTTDKPKAADVALEIASLKNELAALQEQLRTLTKKEKPGSRVGAGADGFTLASADGRHQLRVRGYLHADQRAYASGGMAASTFVLRRVRPVLEATMYERFQLRILPDFGEGRTTLQDAYADVRFSPLVSIRVGKFKAPFGHERLISALELTFAERAAPTLLAPNRDVGLMLQGQLGKERGSYAVALMNGVPDGASGDVDTHPGKDVIGRIVAKPFPASAPALVRDLTFGSAITVGSEAGLASDPAMPTYKTASQQTFFRYRSDGTLKGTTLAKGDRLRASLQGSWSAGSLAIMAESTWARQELVFGTQSGEVVNRAWVLTGLWMLAGEPITSRRLGPQTVFDPGAHHWGAVELDVRVSRFEADRAAYPIFADAALSARVALEWALGCNWYLNRTVKVVASFHDTTFDGGAPEGDRRPERVVLSRLQFAF